MIPENIFSIIQKLENKGHKAYIAGGAVRDILLKRKFKDIDILTSATIPEIESVFSDIDSDIDIVGKTFPICIINGIEVSPARGGKAGFPESDLAKRDFTINAMAMDKALHKLIDPFNGQKDLKERIIRFTGEPLQRINEDPVRMLRACRFKALLGGNFSLSSQKAILSSAELLDKAVAKERIGQEILKAMTLRKPSLFFRALKDSGLLCKIFPSLDRCYDLDGGPHHNESVFEHCLLVGDALPPELPVLRLAGYLHDTGKYDAAVMKDGRLYFAGHEKHVKEISQELTELKFSAKHTSYIIALIKAHMHPLKEESSPRAVRRLLSKLAGLDLSYRDFMRMRIADRKGNLAKKPYTLSDIRLRLKKIQDEIQQGHAFSINDLEISGHDIMNILSLPPSPEIGKIKAFLFEKVMDEPLLNRYEELERLCLSFPVEFNHENTN